MSAYLERLEDAARAPDSVFPEILFNPMKNVYDDDVYFVMDIEDYGSDAMSEDPRFTASNIFNIRPNSSSIEQHLANCALYDDYTEYLCDKYGSLRLALELIESGDAKEPALRTRHRPRLKKSRDKRLFEAGVMPSSIPRCINAEYMWDLLVDLTKDAIDVGEHEEEPDIEWANNSKPSKESRKAIETEVQRIRQFQRRQQLSSGVSAGGFGGMAFDFTEHYYAENRAGAYSEVFNNGQPVVSIADMIKEDIDYNFMNEGERLTLKEGLSVSADTDEKRYDAISGTLVSKRYGNMPEIYKHIREQMGINLLERNGMGKREYKVMTAEMETCGIYTSGMTEKEINKKKKRRNKIEDASNRSLRGSQQLREILLHHHLNNDDAPIRFEDTFYR